MDERPTSGWLATRFELALGAACLAFPVVMMVVGPPSRVMGLSEPSVLGIPLGAAILAVGYVGMVIGMLWMLRITRRGPEDGRPTIWRYRER